MTVQPAHERIDVGAVVLAGLREELPGSAVALDRDASYTPDRVLTVVSVSRMSAVGTPGNRWLFDVTVSLMTTGPSYGVTANEAERIGDAMLSLTEVDDVLFSSVSCDSEPARLSPHNPTGAETLAQTFSLMVRRKGPDNG